MNSKLLWLGGLAAAPLTSIFTPFDLFAVLGGMVVGATGRTVWKSQESSFS